jgi:hypothetical protein
MDARWGKRKKETPAKERFTEDNKPNNDVIASGVTDVITNTLITLNNTKDINTISSEVDEDKGQNQEESTKKEVKSTIPYQEIADLWNKTCGDVQIPKVIKLTPERKNRIQRRHKENDADLAWWQTYFERIAASEFCRGGPDGSGWKANIDWATRNQDVVAKVLEGNYDNRQRNGKGPTKDERFKNPWKH